MHLKFEIENYAFQYNKAFDIEMGKRKKEGIFLIAI